MGSGRYPCSGKNEDGMKVILNRERCIGAGRCAELAPRTFGISDSDGLVVLLSESVEGDEDWVVEAAADACPTRAIQIEKSA